MFFAQRGNSTLFLIFQFFNLITRVISEGNLNTTSLIDRYGYPWEEHHVTTKDGYILTTYRIPYSPNNNSSNNKRPIVFIMHGFGASSCDFVLAGPPQGAAFFFSDAGYDVWLGNARGTYYSRKHVTLNQKDARYWKFTWHEIGIYDIPTVTYYILNLTSTEKLQYIGHSQGTTVFLVAASTNAGFNEVIKSSHLMSPVAFLWHIPITPTTALAAYVGHSNPYFSTFGGYNLFENNTDNPFAPSRHTNQTIVSIKKETITPGASNGQIIHYAQLMNSKKFRQFDSGLVFNLLRYHQISPPDYELNNITTPLYLYHSDGDKIADPEDVKELINSLASNVLKKVNKPPFDDWTHEDYIYGFNVDKIVYDVMLNDMQSAQL